MKKNKILFVFGTRPELIKLFPLINQFNKDKKSSIKICSTGQHRELVDQMLDFFKIRLDYDLKLMKPNQNLVEFTSACLIKLSKIIEHSKFEYIIVQGDTTSAFIGALVANYYKIKLIHIEAGLRTFNKNAPFPEEINRKLISSIADYHFPPSDRALKNLKREGITQNAWNVGNTVVDSLKFVIDKLEKKPALIEKKLKLIVNEIIKTNKIVLVTIHRRESFGQDLKNICNALINVANKHKNIKFIIPVHPNPNVKKEITKQFSNNNSFLLLSPLDYCDMIWLITKSHIILSDSGGIQEEVPTLNKPILILRDVTERQEVVEAGIGILVGTNKLAIEKNLNQLIQNPTLYSKMINIKNPYGNGNSSKKILEIFHKQIV